MPSHAVPTSDSSDRVARWLAAIESRHLADFRLAEVTRALRALSSAYVERRHKVAQRATLDSAGKRAAFALYYGPQHFVAARHVIGALAAGPPAHVLDLGCGTGTVGAAWALSGSEPGAVAGIDRHAWAVEEANRTYRELGLQGRARVGDVGRLSLPRDAAVAAGYVLNELPDATRQRVEEQLVAHAAQGGMLLIMEPLARGVAPWWDATAARLAAVGGRTDEWRFRDEVPDLVARLGKAAGLDYRETRLKTIFVPGARSLRPEA